LKEKKLPLGARISQALEIPEDTLGGLSCMSIYGDQILVADCCNSVISYTEETVALQLIGMIVTITGKQLKLSTFRFGRITVSGQISGMEIRPERGKS